MSKQRVSVAPQNGELFVSAKVFLKNKKKIKTDHEMKIETHRKMKTQWQCKTCYIPRKRKIIILKQVYFNQIIP